MSDETGWSGRENAQDAALARAGEPRGASEARAESIGEETPTPEELDAREERLATSSRKPMGPSRQVEQTIPEQP